MIEIPGRYVQSDPIRLAGGLKDFRAVVTRYEKRGHNYLAGVTVATIIL